MIRLATPVALAVVLCAWSATGQDRRPRAKGSNPDQAAPKKQGQGRRDGRALTDVVYRKVGDREVKLDAYPATVPHPNARQGRAPVLLAIHGGGWRAGERTDLGGKLRRFTRLGYAVVTVDYRLARPGRASWPENFEDVREAVRWIRLNADRLRIDPGRIIAFGNSSGGHLASLLGTYPDGPVGVDSVSTRTAVANEGRSRAVSSRVQGVLEFCGASDLKNHVGPGKRSTEAVELFLGRTLEQSPGRYAAASPVTHVSPDDPPFFIVHGTADEIVPIAQTETLAEALEKAGVPHKVVRVKGSGHGLGFELGERDLIVEGLRFIEAAWKTDAPK